MKENFPNLVKEIDFQEVQEAQRVPKKLNPKGNMIKDKERILKAASGKERVAFKGVPIRLSLISQKKPCRQEGAGKKYSK